MKMRKVALIMARIGIFDQHGSTETMICTNHYNILYRDFREKFVYDKKCLWIHHERRYKRTSDSSEPGHKKRKGGPKRKNLKQMRSDHDFSLIDVKKSKKLWKNFEQKLWKTMENLEKL